MFASITTHPPLFSYCVLVLLKFISIYILEQAGLKRKEKTKKKNVLRASIASLSLFLVSSSRLYLNCSSVPFLANDI